MSALDHTYAVILAGGGGTRLWPKSRQKTPKQFLKLKGELTMLQVTAERFAEFIDWDKIVVITLEEYIETVKEQLPKINPENIIAEPEKKDTAMAMLTATLFVRAKDKDAVIVNDAADHMVVDQAEFIELMIAATNIAAEQKYLVTVGITPNYSSTAFGYIQVGEELKRVDRNIPVFKVKSFTEKPNRARARAFLTTGRYFWNANNYVWSATVLKQAFKQHMPEMYELTKKLDTYPPAKFKKKLPAIYQQAEKISIDYAISEKADNLVLIPGDFGWEDIGEWKVVYDLGTKDLAGNVIMGNGKQKHIHILAVESKNNLIYAHDRLIAMIGIEDMIVVDTSEILMIAPMSHSQEVKRLVNRLKEEDRDEYL